MTANIIEINKEWVYLQIAHQIKFRARYSVQSGSDHPAAGNAVRISFVRSSESGSGRFPDFDNGIVPHVVLSKL